MALTLPSVNLEIMTKTATSITQDNIQVFLHVTPCRLLNFTDFSSTVVLLSLAVRYSLIIPPFNATYFDLLTPSLNN